ncbi:MAG: YhbY family RNA-binding protein [Opitutales bacterium]|nr:YhbY family RNA-binding protein [Opitutales bacterium]MCH8541414.1 YhbY family RNA-binding protein [Opitutales bacterium]
MLSSSEKKVLRGEAQLLRPRVKVGKQGLPKGVMEEIESALSRDKLIKVRFEGDRDQITGWIAAIIEKTAAQLVGRVGKTASFYREKEEEERE